MGAKEELSTALEELRAAHGELLAHAEELTATRMLIAVERRRYRDLFELAPDAYLVTDGSGLVVEANRAAGRLVGRARRRLLGRPLERLVASAALPSFRARMNRHEGLTGERWETQLRSATGRRVHVEVHVSSVPSFDGPSGARMWMLRDVSERHAAETQLRADREQLRSLALALERAEERERRRIASDLHDQIGQTLALLRIKLRTLRGIVPRQGRPATEIDEAVHLLDSAVEATRGLTHDLSPPTLYELGLEPALEQLAEEMTVRHGLRVGLTCAAPPTPLAEEVRSAAYRAVREALVNVLKHSGEDSAEVRLERAGRRLRLEIRDRGLGFDARRMRDGVGLFSMRERVGHLGGRVEVRSAKGRGTRVRIVLPVDASPDEGEEDTCRPG